MGLLAEFDRRRGWEGTGCVSCAAWLAWQTSFDLRTAHEKVRVARAIVAFPRMGVEMATGALSYAKVRAVSRIANVDNVDALVDLALVSTSNQLERFVSASRRHEPDSDAAEARAYLERSVSVRNDHAQSTLTVTVPTEDAAVLLACIDLFLGEADPADPLVARRADALMAMAALAISHTGENMPIDGVYLATVHLTPDVFDTDDDGDAARNEASAGGRGGTCCVAPGDGLGADPVSVPRKSARRILCDAVMQGYRHGDNDDIAVGYGGRTVSRRLKRSLRLRDDGCRFPGCTHRAWVDAHHIVHWLDLGPTVPTNLVCLCRRHHRLMHEGGWSISGDPNQHLTFHTPDGRILQDPVPLVGERDAVEDHGRTERDGRCGWDGDRFDLAYTLSVIMGIENRHYLQRTNT